MDTSKTTRNLKINALHRDSDWSGLKVTVVGAGVAGVGAAGGLAELGVDVELIDQADLNELDQTHQGLLKKSVVIKANTLAWAGQRPDLLVVSPGVKPFADVIEQAHAQGVAIWGELELAWRLRPRAKAAQWLLVSGTNGKTTTALMATAMANFDGQTARAIGNIGVSAVEAVLEEGQPDFFVVEASAAQMVFSFSLRPFASIVLNLAPDHLDYFGSMSSYQLAKAKVYSGVTGAAIFNADDPTTRQMIDQVGLPASVRKVGFGLGPPAKDQIGLADDFLVDNAFGSGQIRLAPRSRVHPPALHNVANALAAAGLVRAAGFAPEAVAHGLEVFLPAPHRISDVGDVDGVRFIDDSKATNTHAAGTSIRSYSKVVWVAGGLSKGQDFTGLVQEVRANLRGVVLMGQDKGEIAEALTRHSPDTPVIFISGVDHRCMPEVVRAAASLAQPGDVVLLAPACASWDMFTDYQHRGDCFASAVEQLSASAGARR